MKLSNKIHWDKDKQVFNEAVIEMKFIVANFMKWGKFHEVITVMKLV